MTVRRALIGTLSTVAAIGVVVLGGFRVAAARRERVPNSEAAPRTGRFVRAADVDVFVQEAGPATGTPVLLIHGTGAWSEIWRGTMASLAANGFRAIAVDMPPFGYSTRPTTARYDDDAQARRILGVLDALRLQRVVLVGHSFGARPTMQATFLAPERVQALVLVDAALGLMTPATPAGLPARAVLGLPPLRDALVSATLTNPRFTGRLLSKLVAETAAVTPARVSMLQRPFVVRGTTASFGQWLRPFVTTSERSLASQGERYATLRMPALVLWGERDSLTPLEQGRDLARRIPNARLVTLPHAGHIPAIEDPTAFDAALLSFLHSLQ